MDQDLLMEWRFQPQMLKKLENLNNLKPGFRYEKEINGKKREDQTSET